MTVALHKAPTWMVAEIRRRTGLPILECRRILEHATPAEYQHITGERRSPDSPYRVDPAEEDPHLAAVLLRATLEVDKELEREDRSIMGFCHLFWRTKKRILWEQYGLAWRTPAEMNPHVLID